MVRRLPKPAHRYFINLLFMSHKKSGETNIAVTMMSHDLAARGGFAEPPQPCNISELNRRDEAEVIEFLSARPLHTVFMMGLIRDNGLLSPKNRGSFYGSPRQFCKQATGAFI